MRVFFVVAMLFAVSNVEAAQPVKTKGKTVAGLPAHGIKTPGVQMPFAAVKPDGRIPEPGKPTWLFFAANSLFIPGKAGLEKIDLRPAGGGRGRGAGRGGPDAGKTDAPGAKTPAAEAQTKPDPAKLDPVKPGAKAPEVKAEVKAPDVKAPEVKVEVKAEAKPDLNKPGDPVPGVVNPCGGMTSAFNSLWVQDCSNGTLARLDTRSFKVTKTIPTGTSTAIGTLAASADSVWALVDDRATLARIDPEQNAVVGELRVPAGCRNLIFGETSLWLTCPALNKILRINVATNLIEKQIEVSAEPQSIVIGENSVWVLCRKEGKIDRVDPKTNKVTKTIELKVPGADGSLAFGEGSLWVTQAGFPITRVDPTAETVAQQFYGEGGGSAILTTTGVLWLSSRAEGTLLRIDPKLILATIPE